MRRWFVVCCFSLSAIFPASNLPLPSPAQQIMRVYVSCPKGIILEGAAQGIEKFTTIQYHIGQNRLILNKDSANEISYLVPVDRETLYYLAMALARDDRLGVSLSPTGKEIVYGNLNQKHKSVKQLLSADRLLTEIALGDPRLAQNKEIPFTPRAAINRQFPAVCVHKFFDYRFAVYQGQYYLASLKMANLLFPMADFPAADGGYTTTGDERKIEPTDRENVREMQEFSAQILQLPTVKNAAAIGETAAFLRTLRDVGNADLVALARHIMRK